MVVERQNEPLPGRDRPARPTPVTSRLREPSLRQRPLLGLVSACLLLCLLLPARPILGQTTALLPRGLTAPETAAALGLPAGRRVAAWRDADEALQLLRETRPAVAVLPARAASEALAAGLLAPLAQASDSPAALRLPADPEARLARPWLWSATGLGHDAYTPLPAPVSLKQLWMPAFAGRSALPDDPERVLPLTLLLLGWDAAEGDAAKVGQACAFLGRITRGARTGAAPSWLPLADGSAALGIFDADDAVLANRDAALPRAAFALPEDGFLLQPLFLAVPKDAGAEGQTLAASLLAPKVQATAADRLAVLPADPAALALLPQDLAASPLAVLPPETLGKGRLVLPSPQALAAWRACWKGLAPKRP